MLDAVSFFSTLAVVPATHVAYQVTGDAADTVELQALADNAILSDEFLHSKSPTVESNIYVAIFYLVPLRLVARFKSMPVLAHELPACATLIGVVYDVIDIKDCL